MKEKEKGEEGRKDSTPLQIDPKCFQDALRTFFQPIKNDDPRLDFYTVYKREATEYDTDYVKKYDEDLNTTLIFAGLFSAVSSAFVIDVHSKLLPDPNDQSAALLRAILLTLNQSAIPNESPTVPPVQESPPSEIVTATGLMYASLLISLLAAFTAMLGKQWLNRYLRNAGGSMIERCGDRQRKCDGLQKWPFHLFIESLPVMLQIALLLLACGLCRHMWSINASVAYILIVLAALGLLFYLAIVIVGTSSYECPFQTPASSTLRSFWKKFGHRIILLLPSIAIATLGLFHVVSSFALRLWGVVKGSVVSAVLRSKQIVVQMAWNPTQPVQQIFHHPQSVPLVEIQEDLRMPQQVDHSSQGTNSPSQELISLPSISLGGTSVSSPGSTEPWLESAALTALRKANASDTRCVSWILWNITDPEALDTAIRLAGIVQWFEDGPNVEPPYDSIISTLMECFDPSGKVYTGLRDRVYYSAQAVLWIHICATCVSEEFVDKFPLPVITCDTTSLDPDLSHLLRIFNGDSTRHVLVRLYAVNSMATPVYLQWASNALLHLSWAKQRIPETFSTFSQYFWSETKNTIPLNAVLNHLLTACILLGRPIEEEWLEIQDKLGHFDRILSQFSQAMVAAIHNSHPQCEHLEILLNQIRNSGNRTNQLTEMAYQWCSVVCENYSNLVDGQDLLLLSLEIGFRHLNPQEEWIEAILTHTEHHQKLANLIFRSQDYEAIADLLHAWTSTSNSRTYLVMCVEYLVTLHHKQAFSSRLRQLIIRTINLIGYHQFEQVGVEGFVELLNNLHVCVKEMDNQANWATLLMGTIQSSKKIQNLSYPHWEFLVEFAISQPWWLEGITYVPDPMVSLENAEEWDKLRCWMGVVWMVWPPENGKTKREDLEHITLSLFHQQPSAVQKLEQWMERWRGGGREIPQSFQQICEQEYVRAAQQATISILSINEVTVQSTQSQPSTLPLYFGDDTF